MSGYVREADVALGCLLTVISVAGSLGNGVSFFHFLSRQPVSRKAYYFKYLYMMVTLADFLVCVTLFPMIDATMSPNRSGILESEAGLCSAWSVLWATVPQLTVFLVGMLSVSRLIVIMFPYTPLCVPVSYILPGTVLFFWTSFYFALIAGDVLYPKYEADWLSCQISQFSPAEMDQPVTEVQFDKALYLLMIPMNFIPAFSIFPIIISFLLSVVMLHYKMGKSPSLLIRKKKEAAKTVMAITLVYIIFNIPFSGGMMKGLSTVLGSHDQLRQHNMTAQKFLKENMLPEDKPFVRNYLIPLSMTLICLNSLVNPVIYYSRMMVFRIWLKSLCVKLLSKIITLQ